MDVKEKAKQFAIEDIAGAPDHDLHNLLQKAGIAGLCGIGIPAEYGGAGGGYREITCLGRTLARHGGNAGSAFSLLYHLAVSNFMVLGFGNKRQKENLLPQLAAGKTTISFAASEPGVGAHPKHIETWGEKEGGSFLLRGEKTFVTNGPAAGFYVIIAITARKAHRKQFTAFLTGREVQGLHLTPLDVGFLRSSPHCSLRLEGCRVPQSAVLGRNGSAYRDIVLPFRPLEDVLTTGLICGGLERLFTEALQAIKGSGSGVNGLKGIREKIGRLYSLLTAMDAVSLRTAAGLENYGINQELESLCFWFREMAREFISGLASLPNSAESEKGVFGKDISKLVDLGKNVSALKQTKIGGDILKELEGKV